MTDLSHLHRLHPGRDDERDRHGPLAAGPAERLASAIAVAIDRGSTPASIRAYVDRVLAEHEEPPVGRAE